MNPIETPIKKQFELTSAVDYIKKNNDSESFEMARLDVLISNVGEAIAKVIDVNPELCKLSIEKLYALTSSSDTVIHEKIAYIASKNGINASRMLSYEELPPEIRLAIASYLGAEDSFHLSCTSKAQRAIYKEYLINVDNFGRPLNRLGFKDADKAIDFAVHNKLISVNLIGIEAINDAQIKKLCAGLPDLMHLSLCFGRDPDVREEEKIRFEYRKAEKITNETLAHLSQLGSLKTLKLLGYIEITDAGVNHLSKLTSLEILSLSLPCAITAQGLEPLSKLLALRQLRLTHRGEMADTFLEYVSKLGLLKKLDLSGQIIITNTGIEYLSCLKSLEMLRLILAFQSSDLEFKPLSKVTTLQKLDLTNCVGVTDRELQRIGNFRSLKTLNLKGSRGITDKGIASLSQLASLEILGLSACQKITGAALEHIAKINSLKELDLSFCSYITNEGLMHLSDIQSLKVLKIIFCNGIISARIDCLAHVKLIAK